MSWVPIDDVYRQWRDWEWNQFHLSVLGIQLHFCQEIEDIGACYL